MTFDSQEPHRQAACKLRARFALVRSRQERTIKSGNRWKKLKRFARGAEASRWLRSSVSARLQEMKAEEAEGGLLTAQKEEPHFNDEQRRLTRQSADKTSEIKVPQKRAEPSQLIAATEISCGENLLAVSRQASPLQTNLVLSHTSQQSTETLSRTVLE